MFQIKNISRLFVFLVCLFQSPAFAGIVVGNGGFGVVVDGKLYLQDLVEAGLHQNPVFSRHPGQDPHIRRAVQQTLSNLGDSVELQALLSSKLEDVKAMDPFLAYSIMVALEKYSWRMVTVPLDDPNDSEGVIDEGKTQYRQLALRLGKLIRIQKSNWEQLNTENQVALIIHEMLYALMHMDSNVSKAENSQKVRDLTGYLFSADFYNRGFTGLKTAAGALWALGDGEPAAIYDGAVLKNFKFRYFGFHDKSVQEPNRNLSFSEKWNFAEPQEEKVSRVCLKFEKRDLVFARFTFGYNVYELQFVEPRNDAPKGSNTELHFAIRPERRVEILPDGFAASECETQVTSMIQIAEVFFPSVH